MEVEVSEKEAREIRVGVGYGTEDQFRAQLRWQHNNWLGGGRRLSIEAKYSSIFTTGAITLVQPHFFSPRTRGIISLGKTGMMRIPICSTRHGSILASSTDSHRSW